jgi:NAD(P)-dependent dehydrogenase (short-subunit alcohol dehydrogenase family)
LERNDVNLTGAVALVTGANRGIGRAFVQELLDRGATRVYAGVRDVSSAGSDDPRVAPVALDVTDAEQIAAAAAKLTDVTVLVNNAGIGTAGTALQSSLDVARQTMETNYLGVVAVTQAFAPVLAANGGGAVVNILSVASWVAPPVLASYAPSKAAAWSWTNAARVELRQQNTHVVGVHVGYVDTDLSAWVDDAKLAPAVVADAALRAVETGADEALVDESSRTVKSALHDDMALLYPDIEREFLASRS